MFNRIISHDTFGIVKVGNDAIGDTKLAIRFCQFPLSSTKKIDKRNLKKKTSLIGIKTLNRDLNMSKEMIEYTYNTNKFFNFLKKCKFTL